MQPEPERSFTPWQLRTPATARQPRPPTEYVVDKFFARGSLNVVYGAPGSMKSMLLADMCCAVVDGKPWLPNVMGRGKGIEVKKTGILWYDYDNGTRRTDERFDALMAAPGREIADDDPLYYVSMPQSAYIASDIESTLYLIDLINTLGVELVVIDNLGQITGDVEENSAQMTQVMGALRIVAERTNAAVIVIHHQRKGGSNGGRAGDAVRGHSSIEASLDLALHVVREPDSNEIGIRSTKTRGVDVPQIIARFNYTHRAGTHDLESAWCDGVPSVRGDNPITEAIRIALRDAEPHGMTKGRLVDAVHEMLNGEEGVNKIRNWVSEMVVVSKEIIEESGDRNAKIMRLNGDF